MAVFDADKDISPGIVVSVPFFGGILALLMIGGARISHFFFQSGLFSLCVSFPAVRGDDDRSSVFISVAEMRPRGAFPEKCGTKTRRHSSSIGSACLVSFLKPFRALCR